MKGRAKKALGPAICYTNTKSVLYDEKIPKRYRSLAAISALMIVRDVDVLVPKLFPDLFNEITTREFGFFDDIPHITRAGAGLRGGALV